MGSIPGRRRATGSAVLSARENRAAVTSPAYEFGVALVGGEEAPAHRSGPHHAPVDPDHARRNSIAPGELVWDRKGVQPLAGPCPRRIASASAHESLAPTRFRRAFALAPAVVEADLMRDPPAVQRSDHAPAIRTVGNRHRGRCRRSSCSINSLLVSARWTITPHCGRMAPRCGPRGRPQGSRAKKLHLFSYAWEEPGATASHRGYRQRPLGHRVPQSGDLGITDSGEAGGRLRRCARHALSWTAVVTVYAPTVTMSFGSVTTASIPQTAWRTRVHTSAMAVGPTTTGVPRALATRKGPVDGQPRRCAAGGLLRGITLGRTLRRVCGCGPKALARRAACERRRARPRSCDWPRSRRACTPSVPASASRPPARHNVGFTHLRRRPGSPTDDGGRLPGRVSPRLMPELMPT